jgi:hypothetical protein
VKAVAIVSAHNEADILGPVLEHLIREGLLVYLLDHESTDGTARVAEPFLGRGLLAIEPFPGGRFPAARSAFAWTDILTRKQEIAAEIDADWFIHHDADEFRESPWEGLSLIEAMARVDRFGYNAIDFALFNFWPTDDGHRPGDDPRPTIRYCEPGREWDKLQVKCWKKQPAADLVSSGGHDVAFPGRQVCPLRFILRHYPIRGQAHGARKVFVERRPRLVAEEVARGWHVQHAGLNEGESFLRDLATLREYDGEAARFTVMVGNRDLEAMQSRLTIATAEYEARKAAKEARIAAYEAQVASLEEHTARLHAHRERQEAHIEELRVLVPQLLRDIEALRRDLAGMYASKSWKWTAPLRAIHSAVIRRHDQ